MLFILLFSQTVKLMATCLVIESLNKPVIKTLALQAGSQIKKKRNAGSIHLGRHILFIKMFYLYASTPCILMFEK